MNKKLERFKDVIEEIVTENAGYVDDRFYSWICWLGLLKVEDMLKQLGYKFDYQDSNEIKIIKEE